MRVMPELAEASGDLPAEALSSEAGHLNLFFFFRALGIHLCDGLATFLL